MERLRCEITDGLAQITLVAPDCGNAIDPEWALQFRDAAHGLHNRDDVRVVLLSAQGSAFCVGGDLRHFASLGDPYAALHELAELCTRGCWCCRSSMRRWWPACRGWRRERG